MSEFDTNLDARTVSTMEETDKKCPNCGATVVYNPETLGMTCDFCGYHRELPRPEDGGSIQELDFASWSQRKLEFPKSGAPMGAYHKLDQRKCHR